MHCQRLHYTITSRGGSALFSYKNKLIMASILNTFLGIMIIGKTGEIMSRDSVFADPGLAMVTLGLFPVIGLMIMFIVYIIAIFELVTTWISFITNKQAWVITHIIVLTITSIIGMLLYFSLLFSVFVIIQIVLRIVIVFDKKKPDHII